MDARHFASTFDIHILTIYYISPNLSHKENLWNTAQRQLNQMQPRPATAAQFHEAIVHCVSVNPIISDSFRTLMKFTVCFLKIFCNMNNEARFCKFLVFLFFVVVFFSFIVELSM